MSDGEPGRLSMKSAPLPRKARGVRREAAASGRRTNTSSFVETPGDQPGNPGARRKLFSRSTPMWSRGSVRRGLFRFCDRGSNQTSRAWRITKHQNEAEPEPRLHLNESPPFESPDRKARSCALNGAATGSWLRALELWHGSFLTGSEPRTALPLPYEPEHGEPSKRPGRT